MSRLVRYGLACVFLLFGIAGLVLPLVHGWLFLAAALFLVAPDLTLFDRVIAWLEKRHPGTGQRLRRWRARLRHRPAARTTFCRRLCGRTMEGKR
ncbi:MAG: hypothetical protein HYU36_24885 [Planctomycetes bacterium]|nr:hypothetical protein [Planctomycetota bacterium]